MIRARMQSATETLLSKTQYGFRPNRSTSHAIYVIRRIQDHSEIKGANLSIASLDWEKHLVSFNMTNLLSLCTDWVSIRTTQMSSPIVIETPSSLFKIILDVLTRRFNPLGFAKAAHYHLFYLFLSWLVLTGTYNKLVYYADDTVLFSRSNRGLNELLRYTEQISKGYGLSLNKSKCVAIAMTNDFCIHFGDGTPLGKEFEAMYLGNEINRTVKYQARSIQ